MNSLAALIFSFIMVSAMGVALFLLLRSNQKKVDAYRLALEANQKKLDHQMSRLNILSRAVPGLQALVNTPNSADSWQSLALDESRALIWADGAGYWRFLERERELELQVSRGLELGGKESRIRIDLDVGILAEAAKSRIGVIATNNEIVSEPQSLLAVPLIVSGELWGVFRYLRKGDERLNVRDMELITMFVKQAALAIENRELVQNREKFYLELVQTLADILDSRDAATAGQTKEARRLARGIAHELDMPAEFTYYLEYAALMHDIGKIAIDDQLLRKPGKLTPQEFEIVKTHPEIGYKILAPVTMLAPVAPMVLYHQEWFNGKGYPEGLSGEEIPLGARIVAILDAWAAMTSSRPWRPALTKEEAIKEIKKGADTQFDPRVVEAFLATIEKDGIPTNLHSST